MRPEKLHFSEVTVTETERDVTATRYFPTKDVSQATAGVNHLAPLCTALSSKGWIETNTREPYMYAGRKTKAIEYERGGSKLLLTVYSEGNAVWVFVKIRGVGSDVIELRNWMHEYETGYGR